MRDWLSELRIYSPGYQAIDWGFDYPQVVDLATALSQPIRIASLPVFYNNPQDFGYRDEFEGLDLEKFDLVLFTDIEYRRLTDIQNWIKTLPCPRHLLMIGGLYNDETLDERTIFRPTWSFTFLRWNPPRNDFPLQRPYLWEALLGARREHRDFVMLGMQESALLEKSIVTYRDIFVGNHIDQTPSWVQQAFPNTQIQWPYVSANLDPAWEVRGGQLDNTISSDVPWEIWNRCYYSIIAETLSQGPCFLMAEKLGKCCLARRLFVVFGTANWLANVRRMGFETFGLVLDESYDSIEDPVQRWARAFDQIQYLSQQDPQQILQKIRPVLDHNHHHLFALRQTIADRMLDMLHEQIMQVRDPV